MCINLIIVLDDVNKTLQDGIQIFIVPRRTSILFSQCIAKCRHLLFCGPNIRMASLIVALLML